MLVDQYAARILVSAFKRPTSAIELSRNLGIPIANCYRRIHALEGMGLIASEGRILTNEGKRLTVYRSHLKNAQIFLDGERIRVRIELSDGQVIDEGEGVGSAIYRA